MSKAIVNMTPNPSDIQTIHCSQGDTEAREWEFELHNNGEVIDAGGITEQMVFKSYEGGTEQILPENGVVPVTAPFVGDIKYPDATRTDQEFTYRQSPTESDGLAKIIDIKGNTLVWNQLVQNGNFADTSVWTKGNCTFNVSNNVLTFKATAQYGNTYNTINNVANHVCLLLFEAKSYTNTGTVFFFRQHKTATSYTNVQQILTNAWAKYNIRVKCDSDTIYLRPLLQDNNSSDWGDIQLKNVMVIDLTEMFGAGNEPSAEGFLELFPNDYYEYTTGQYMNIGQPVSLKTVGKNQVFKVIEVCNIDTTGKLVVDGQSYYDMAVAYVVKGQQYTFQPSHANEIMGYFESEPSIGSQTYDKSRITNGTSTFTAQITGYVAIRLNRPEINAQLEFGSTATEYESYTESTLSIPLDEFPNGMDGVGDVHDEKNETGYVKRFATIKVDTVASGSLRSNGDYYAAVNSVTNAMPADNYTVANMICNICETMSADARYNSTKDAVCARINGSIELCISGITSRADLQTYVDSHDIYITYELATPLENYGVVDLGTLSWYYTSGGQGRFASGGIASSVKSVSANTVVANINCIKYSTISAGSVYNGNVGIAIDTSGSIWVHDTTYGTDAIAFKQAMQGVYLLYEKENPQGFTTASLVTENGEVALANENGVLVGKCNSDVSADADFIEGKIRLSDSDGDVYSNKIQIHVEGMSE